MIKQVQEHMKSSGRKRVFYIKKENRGRDISALLVTGTDIIERYNYICFLHDKKEHNQEVKADTDLWIWNLWGNLIGSSYHIKYILRLFMENEELGILAPPEPIGDHFCTWYGFGWHNSFEITREIGKKMELSADISVDKPPITIGSVLWFKANALRKLFSVGWNYNDFDDSRLTDRNYLSYGIERIFAYVAQDAGYETGTVMTVEYARKQISYIQYSTRYLLSEAREFFPISSISDLEQYKKNVERMIAFASQSERLYLYGAGEQGKFCFSILKRSNLSPIGYLISGKQSISVVNSLPVYSLERVKSLAGCAIIITVLEEKNRKEIEEKLKARGFYNYIEFWSGLAEH